MIYYLRAVRPPFIQPLPGWAFLPGSSLFEREEHELWAHIQTGILSCLNSLVAYLTSFSLKYLDSKMESRYFIYINMPLSGLLIQAAELH